MATPARQGAWRETPPPLETPAPSRVESQQAPPRLAAPPRQEIAGRAGWSA
ncbi:MAG TPA: hypothetical protein VHB47_05240 [Thermoanaerobaculia bacterium]|nr:hypothetical protein [Thermoanaerobaculia bacterium]